MVRLITPGMGRISSTKYGAPFHGAYDKCALFKLTIRISVYLRLVPAEKSPSYGCNHRDSDATDYHFIHPIDAANFACSAGNSLQLGNPFRSRTWHHCCF